MAGFDRIPGINEDNEFPLVVRNKIKENLVEKSTEDFVVYGRSDSGEIVIPFSENPFENTLVHRYTDGRVRVGDAVADEDAVSKAQLDAVVIPNFIFVAEGDPIPEGTPANTVIFRYVPEV